MFIGRIVPIFTHLHIISHLLHLHNLRILINIIIVVIKYIYIHVLEDLDVFEKYRNKEGGKKHLNIYMLQKVTNSCCSCKANVCIVILYKWGRTL